MKTLRIAALLTLALLPACHHAVYLPGPNQPRPNGAFETQTLWALPTDASLHRMRLVGGDDPDASSGNLTIYRTTWRSEATGHQPRLIVFQNTGSSLGGYTYWDVFAYDQDLELIDFGTVSFNEMTPFAIIEVNANSDQLPAGYTDRWRLAVIAGRPAEAQGLEIFETELVEWSSDWDELEMRLSGIDPNDLTIRYRPAEPGIGVTATGEFVIEQ